MSKNYDPWEQLRNVALTAKASFKNYKTDNLMRIVPIPEAGIDMPMSGNRVTRSFATVQTIRSCSIITYLLSADDGHSDIARVVGIATVDGAGEVLDPPHLAVISLSYTLESVYLRFVHPARLIGIASSADTSFVRWFFSDSVAFTLENLTMLLMNIDYGAMNSQGFSECVDGDSLLPHPRLSYYASRFSRVRQQRGASCRLMQAEHDFEVWLCNQNYREVSGEGLGITSATHMLEVYLMHQPARSWELKALTLLAETIGTIRGE